MKNLHKYFDVIISHSNLFIKLLNLQLAIFGLPYLYLVVLRLFTNYMGPNF